MYIDLNILKENGFSIIIYYIHDKNKVFAGSGAGLPGIFILKKISKTGSFPSKLDIQLIMFLSKILNKAERNYKATELKMAGII